MAKISLIVKTEKKQRAYKRALENNKIPKFPTRVYNRCKLCGRPKGFLRKFNICRICFRELAQKGEIMGVRKSSW